MRKIILAGVLAAAIPSAGFAMLQDVEQNAAEAVEGLPETLTAEQQDLRCMIILGYFVHQSGHAVHVYGDEPPESGSEEERAVQAAGDASMFFLGKLFGRNPDFDLMSAREQSPDLFSNENAVGNVYESCIGEFNEMRQAL